MSVLFGRKIKEDWEIRKYLLDIENGGATRWYHVASVENARDMGLIKRGEHGDVITASGKEWLKANENITSF